MRAGIRSRACADAWLPVRTQQHVPRRRSTDRGGVETTDGGGGCPHTEAASGAPVRPHGLDRADQSPVVGARIQAAEVGHVHHSTRCPPHRDAPPRVEGPQSVGFAPPRDQMAKRLTSPRQWSSVPIHDGASTAQVLDDERGGRRRLTAAGGGAESKRHHDQAERVADSDGVPRSVRMTRRATRATHRTARPGSGAGIGRLSPCAARRSRSDVVPAASRSQKRLPERPVRRHAEPARVRSSHRTSLAAAWRSAMTASPWPGSGSECPDGDDVHAVRAKTAGSRAGDDAEAGGLALAGRVHLGRESEQ